MAPTDHPFYNNLMIITNDLINAIVAAQTAYFAAKLASEGKGRYFQGIITPATQLDGTSIGNMDVNVHPTDQADTWFDFDSDLFPQGKPVPYQIRIDVYEGPNGWGYIITGDLYYSGLGPDAYGNDGDHLCYRHHVGPETQSGVFNEWFILLDAEGP